MAFTPEQLRIHRALRKAEGRAVPGGHKRPPPAPWPGPAVFIDGEAFDDGHYALLQTYDPRDGAIHTTEAPEGRLTTLECFQHLFKCPKALHFGYGLKYDISNWLADVPVSVLQQVRTHNHARWREFRLELIPGKVLKVCDFTRPKGDRQRIVYDLLPFFQQPYIASLDAANIPIPFEIEWGKPARGRFAREVAAELAAYNEAELLTMEELFRSLCVTLDAGDCRIRHWFGPGAAARHLANRHEVTVSDKERSLFLAQRRDLTNAGLEEGEVLAARARSPHACVVDAFFGGRFELSQHGPIDECWEYDLSSAYPWALASGMPCFACGGEWRPVAASAVQCVPTVAVPVTDPWMVCQVAWEPLKGGGPMWGPFPVRMTRNLAWTRAGIGWYHRTEVEAALKHLSHLFKFRVFQGWSWHPACDHDPWSWVGDTAAERVACKQTDPAKAQCLKLALNSLYGITADKAGVDNGRIPQYHNPYWAGLITARTRARLLQAAAVGGEDIVYLATDGVHSKRPLDLPVGDGLGDWEPPKRAGIPAVFLAPGTYLYADGKRGKTRGVNLGKFSSEIATWRRLYRMTAPRGGINLLDRHFTPFVEALSRASGVEGVHYHDILNTWSVRPRVCSYNLAPRRERREDGRWVAPDYADWIALAQVFVIPQDGEMRREEEWASYQPDYAHHKLIAAVLEEG